LNNPGEPRWFVAETLLRAGKKPNPCQRFQGNKNSLKKVFAMPIKLQSTLQNLFATLLKLQTTLKKVFANLKNDSDNYLKHRDTLKKLSANHLKP